MNIVDRVFSSPARYLDLEWQERADRLRKHREQCMKSHTTEAKVIPFERPSASAERAWLEQRIAANEREIARLANQVRWWKLEIEGL